MFLHSGDILIMSGDARKCYHAVPKIIKATTMREREILSFVVGKKGHTLLFLGGGGDFSSVGILGERSTRAIVVG